MADRDHGRHGCIVGLGPGHLEGIAALDDGADNVTSDDVAEPGHGHLSGMGSSDSPGVRRAIFATGPGRARGPPHAGSPALPATAEARVVDGGAGRRRELARRVGTLVESSPSRITMTHTRAPSRARSGTSGWNPATRRGSAVTGPTATRVSRRSSASRSISSPASVLLHRREPRDSTGRGPEGDSVERSGRRVADRTSSAFGSGGAPHWYTTSPTVCAPASVSATPGRRRRHRGAARRSCGPERPR